jgi:GWxTD domain-containing protein
MNPKKIISRFLGLVFLLSVGLSLYAAESSLYTAFQKKKEPKDWIDGPVGYIVTSEEKKQYKKLSTEAEKEKFIKWFWARRETNPETYRNEFRDEFNERVRYANANFKERGLEGWETARGHVYIVYGPPSREWQEIIQTGNRPAIFWQYDEPPSRYSRVMEPLVFVELYRNGRYYLMRPMPMDYFEYYFQMMRGRSYFELVPDEYFRAFEEVNKNAIQKRDLKIEDVAGNEVASGVSTTEEIPFEWQTDFIPSSDNKVQVNITIKLKYKDISYYQSESKYKANFGLSIKLVQNEELAETHQDEINVELTEKELMAKANDYMVYTSSLNVLPGKYTLEIILENNKTHISKTVREELTVELKPE